MKDGICYDHLDLTLIDNQKNDKPPLNLNYSNMFIKTFNSKKLKDLIDQGLNFNSNTLILYLCEDGPLILDLNMKQSLSFKSILPPL